MEKKNIFNDMKNIRLDYLTVENFEDLVNCEYDLRIDDLVICDRCEGVFSDEDIVREEVEVQDTEDYWDYGRETPEQRIVTYHNEVESCPLCDYGSDYEYEEFEARYYTLEDMLSGIYKGLEDYVGKDFIIRLEQYLNNDIKNESLKEGKMNLQEATIKALYNGLKDNTEVEDVEGLVDDVLVITDPEITTDEYNEIIERAEEIVEDTPEGDIPLDPTYLGEYLQTCPICGGSFVDDHILEPGTACPICYETPEAFVMVGKLQAEEEVADDNGLKLDGEEKEPELELDEVPVDELGNTESEIEKPEVDVEEDRPAEAVPEERPTRVRGARQRLNREVASKEVPTGNVLTETRVNQAILRDRETEQAYTYKELQDMYNKELSTRNIASTEFTFEQFMEDLTASGKYITLTENLVKNRK